MRGLSLFQPIFLWALAACAIPVIIHLINRQKTRRLDFSTLRFFRATAARAAKSRRIRRMALLCSRVLLLGCLALIFAKPFDRHDPFAAITRPDGAVYFGVDPTVSMEYKDGGEALRHKALRLVDSLDRKLPPSAKRYFYDEARNGFFPAAAAAPMQGGFTRYGPPRPEKMLRAYTKQTRRGPNVSALILFSDFQENIVKALDSALAADPSGPSLTCVWVGPRTPWNFSVRSAIASPERPGALLAGVAARGKPCGNSSLSAFSGSMRTGRKTIEVKEGGDSVFSMDILNGPSLDAGRVQLEAEDPFPIDNVRYFTRGASRGFRVLVIGDSVKSFPVAAAFRALDASFWRSVAIKSAQSVGLADVDSADVIVLNELTYVPRAIQTLFIPGRFGKKAILFSPAITPSDPAPQATDGLPWCKGAALLCEGTEQRPAFPALYDTVSLLWKGFPRLRDLDAAFYRYMAPLPGSALIGLTSGKPLAAQLIDSLGNCWVLFASPIGVTPCNNLCETGFYLPFLDRTARWGLQCISPATDQWTAGVPRRDPYFGSRRGALVYDEQGRQIAQWGNQPTVAFDAPGLYKILHAGEAAYEIAVNADWAEGIFPGRMPEVPAGLRGRMRFLDAAGFLDGLNGRKKFAAAWWLWGILAALLLAEVLLWERNPSRGAES